MFLAQPVADTAGLPFPFLIDMAVLEIHKAHVVKNHMIMNVIAINVGRLLIVIYKILLERQFEILLK